MAALAASSAVLIGAIELATALGYPVSPGLAMLILAPCVLHLGAMKAQFGFASKKAAPPVSQQDALAMPLVAGCALVSLYLAFKYFDVATVNLLLLAYFCLIGTGTWGAIAYPIFDRPVLTKTLFTIPAIPYVLPDPVVVNPAVVLSTALGAVIPALYAQSKHWLANNAMGVAFCVEGLALADLGDFMTGAYMLGGLFAYDIFMVFGTKKVLGGPSVMESVATSVDGPIKLIFPLPSEQAVGRDRPYSLLGLGDIIVPGVFLVLLLRFDAHNAKQRALAKANASAGSKDSSSATTAITVPEPAAGSYPTPYFNVAFLAYVAGLCATLAAMHWANTAQPALLYLCPACGLAPVLVALAKGEFSELVGYTTEAAKEAADAEKKAAEEAKAKAQVEKKSN